MNTRSEVLKVLDGASWFARYNQDNDSYSFEPVITFLVLRTKAGTVSVVGLVPDGSRVEKAPRWSNFDGYCRRD